MAQAIDERSLSASLGDGLNRLNALSQGDYGRDIADLIGDPDLNQDQKMLCLGRLMGVAIKQPFSTPMPMDPATSTTGALRGWDLLGEKLDTPQSAATWQFQAMGELSREFGFDTEFQFAMMAKHETGFLVFFGKSFQKYLCGDPQMAKKIEKAVEKLKALGGIKHLLTPEGMIGAAASSLAAMLIAAVPWLTVASGPLLVALMVILATIGLDAFCTWSGALDRLNAEAEK